MAFKEILFLRPGKKTDHTDTGLTSLLLIQRLWFAQRMHAAAFILRHARPQYPSPSLQAVQGP